MALQLEKHVAKTNEFLNELAQELGIPGNKDSAGRVLRVVLHGIRSLLSVGESLHLLAQLPMFLKALYVDGWSPTHQKRHLRHSREFINEILRESHQAGVPEISDEDEASEAIWAVISVLKRHVSAGEIHKIKAQMSQELKRMWDEAIKV